MDEKFELAQDIFNALSGNTGDQLKANAKLLAIICQRLVETGTIARSDIDLMIAEAQR